MGYNKSWSQLGGIKMIIIPSYLRQTTTKMDAVLQRKIIEKPITKKFEADRKKVNSVIENLSQKESEIIASEDYYVTILNAMDELVKIAEELSFKDCQEIFLRTEVDDALIDALNHAEILHPEMRSELEKIAQLIKNPNAAIEKVDAYCDCKILKFVKTEEEWLKI